jgi:Aspartyl protease
MKNAFSKLYQQLIVAISLATVSVPALTAESHCPANIVSVTPRLVQGVLVIIPVKINNAGPFDFMVDTGSQLTVIDSSLASQVGLKSQGQVGLVSVAKYAQASVAVVDSLEAGSKAVARPAVVVQDLGQIRAADPRMRGVLGLNFLAHFDLLIDYGRKLLCLDDTKAMEAEIRGEHVPLVAPAHPESETPFAERLVISVRLSDTGKQPIRLQLDSGSDGAILYASNKETERPLLARAALQGGDTSPAQRAFAVLPPQLMRIGSRTWSNVPFVTPVRVESNVPDREEDGLLPTVLFQKVYISYAEHYVVFDSR